MVLVRREIHADDFDDVRLVGGRHSLADFDLPVDVALVLHDLFGRDETPTQHATVKDCAESSLPNLSLKDKWAARHIEDLVQLYCSLPRRPNHRTCDPKSSEHP